MTDFEIAQPFEPPPPTDVEIDEAYAIDALVSEDRSEEAQARRVDDVAMRVAQENADAPSEEEVEAFYTGEPLPEPELVEVTPAAPADDE